MEGGREERGWREGGMEGGREERGWREEGGRPSEYRSEREREVDGRRN